VNTGGFSSAQADPHARSTTAMNDKSVMLPS
jgi:hypothetical protein